MIQNVELDYNLEYHVNMVEVTQAVSQTINSFTILQNTTNNTFEAIQEKADSISFKSVVSNLKEVSDGLTAIAQPGEALSTSMYELRAASDITGTQLQAIEEQARNTAKEFGGSATDSMKAYKELVSQLSPEIAQMPDALGAMGDSIATTSKLMGGDSAAATELLITAMNQYGVSTKDPIAASQEMSRMMNVMAAAAQTGTAGLPEIQSALEQTGMAASKAGLSFEETNAAIQVLDQAGKQGAEGGTALRNVLSGLGDSSMLPPDVRKELEHYGVNLAAVGDQSKPLADRLRALEPVMNNQALLAKIFSKENADAAQALIGGADAMAQYTQNVTGTAAASEQAAAVMNSPAERAKRMQATIDDLKVSLFESTGGWLSYASVASSTLQDVSNLWPAISMGGKVIGTITGGTKTWAAVQKFLNEAMNNNPIMRIVTIVGLLIAAISYVIAHTEGWGQAWDYTVKAVTFGWHAFTDAVKLLWLEAQDYLLGGFEAVAKGWYAVQSLWDEEGAQAGIAALDKSAADRAAEKEATKKSMVDNAAASVDALQKARGSVKWRDSDAMGTGETNKAFGSAGVVGSSATPGAHLQATGLRANAAIVGAAQQAPAPSIHVGNLIGHITFTTGTPQEQIKRLRDLLVDEISKALSMGTSRGLLTK